MSAGCALGGLLCLMDFFYYIDLICRRNFATAVATKGQWKQTKSAIALGNLRRRCFWGYLRLVYAVTLKNDRHTN